MTPKDCNQNGCTLIESVEWSTLIYVPPVYDKNGNNINPDTNKKTSLVECMKCHRKWKKETIGDKITYIELTK